MSMTVLDAAHAAMVAAPDDEMPRLKFYERLTDAELFVLLEDEPKGGQIRPRVFPLEDGPVVLAFDREERLAAFAEGAADHAEMTGRALVPMLAGADLGLGLNLGVAPSEILLPAEALRWLAGLLAERPALLEDVPERLAAPGSASEALLRSLDAKMPGLAGLAGHALLAEAAYAGGGRQLVLAFGDVLSGAEAALARAAGEALIFSGAENGAMDVTFLEPGGLADRFARVGLRFDIPRPVASRCRKPPGMDPNAPPRLR